MPTYRHRMIFLGIVCGFCMTPSAYSRQSLDKLIEPEIPSLTAAYKTLHAAPELSGYEKKTSAFLAGELRALGYTVTEKMGKYERPGLSGYGVAAILKNGQGPTVLVRADMDALPIEEKTELPYASKVKTTNNSGQEVSVMHACGHDLHITALLGTAKMLVRLKDKWRGTVMLIGEPAEEISAGTRALISDGLYTGFPKPDYALALHTDGDLAAGKVGYCPGYAFASSTAVDITIRGVGGHGARPEAAKDPVVAAAQVVLALQTIVSRETSPLDPSVVTVGSIHGGTKHNIIPDEVKLQLTVRAYKDDVRKMILASIERIIKGITLAAGIPEDRAAIVESKPGLPAVYNDPGLTKRLVDVFEKTLGPENTVKTEPFMGGDDFGLYGLEGHKIPILMFRLGVTAPEKIAESQRTGIRPPSVHSSMFAPWPEPALRTGVKAMTSAILELMKK